MGQVCQGCGHRGGADLSFMWFVRKFEVERKKDGAKKERTLWLCPDCAEELGSVKKAEAFLRKALSG